ncbi:MAG TPA: hypothetical protein IAD07_02885 [Candidatus Fimivicinus intestinavium]|nr:hypothetical protein [Candidatus Fimivicinus intestinavium]
MSKKVVRVIAIVLAVLMAGGVFAAALQVFAVSPEAAVPVAATGQRSYWPVIVALAAAVIVVALCIIIPKVSKKK